MELMPGVLLSGGRLAFGLGLNLSRGRRCGGDLGLWHDLSRIGPVKNPMLQSQGVDDTEQTDKSDNFSQHHE
jgi:hypothetical protein